MITGRYAPSPSGRMHLGNLLCCLLAWLSAKSQGGQVLLRIEDLDTQRCPRHFADAIVEDLAWLGLSADGPQPPVYQSERSEIYQYYYKKLADRGPCVIVGRCGDYVLREYPGLINVFICADREDRIRRIAQRYDMSERKAAEKIKRIDRERRYYYESHTGMEWGSIEAHQVLLNVSRLGLEGTVDLLEMMYRA